MHSTRPSQKFQQTMRRRTQDALPELARMLDAMQDHITEQDERIAALENELAQARRKSSSFEQDLLSSGTGV